MPSIPGAYAHLQPAVEASRYPGLLPVHLDTAASLPPLAQQRLCAHHQQQSCHQLWVETRRGRCIVLYKVASTSLLNQSYLPLHLRALSWLTSSLEGISFSSLCCCCSFFQPCSEVHPFFAAHE